MDELDHTPDNPYTGMEGYKVLDASRNEVGEVEGTVYDAPSDVLKYVVVDGRAVPAESLEIDADNGRVLTPYDREIIESAPEMQEISGAFDTSVREHFGESR